MKLISRVLSVTVPLMIVLSLLGCREDGPLVYQEKLLVSVEWGAKAGKFGLAIPAEGEVVGPRTFTVYNDGYIHVFDSIKQNIKVFNGEGVFQRSIGKGLPGYSFTVYEGHYYLLDGENVYQYTLSGSMVETYPIAPAISLHEGYGQWMRIVAKGDLYVKSQGKAYRICEGIGGRKTVLSAEAQIRSERRGTPNSAGNRWFTLNKESTRRYRLRMSDNRGNPLKEFPIETKDTLGSIFFLEQDEENFIYLEVQRIGADGSVHLEIRRYRADGRLIQSMELPNKYFTVVYKKIFVDKKGTPYQLRTAPSGVKIVKWERG